jgi:indole-3-glycerol phosphate synthase
MSSVLERIFAAKRSELEERRHAMPLAAVAAEAARAPAPRDFAGALRAHRPAIIAEIKRASPSKGDILPGLDPATVAREYAAAGAAALSVLTDRHFKGTLDDLRAVRAAVDIPLLRKDFMFDAYQVHEARAAGADCILLIAAMLAEAEMRELARCARELGMAALVEVHNRDEFMVAERIGAELLGINNRDLHTFETSLSVTEELLRGYAGRALIVAESGIDSPADIRRLADAGARAFLIGESLLRDGHPRERLGAMVGAFGRSRAT